MGADGNVLQTLWQHLVTGFVKDSVHFKSVYNQLFMQLAAFLQGSMTCIVDIELELLAS